MNISLKDKLIFITGGSMGIGYAVTRECLTRGANVVIASRTGKTLKKTVYQLAKSAPGRVQYRVLDVSRREAVSKCAKWLREKYGALDGLVNCAGIFGSIGTLDKINLNEFECAIKINLLGTVYTCHYFAPLMKNRGARIVNYSGGGATTPFPNYSAYAASKAAVVRLTENLAEEYKPLGIEVNAVAPGFVVTRLHKQTFRAGKRAGQQYLDFIKKQVARGGVPPELAAGLTAFLLSGESAGINGKVVSANWDKWGESEFVEKLKSDKHLATLRRIDGLNFVAKP